jgi:2-hydroxychromene-2-carboxylate isomerase
VDADQPIFYYDLGSPTCYLVAERIMSELPIVPEWEPVLGASLGALVGAPPGAPGGAPGGAPRRASVSGRPGAGDCDLSARELIERRATELELQPMRWPTAWPPDTREAMLAATYAKRVGRAVAFSLAAFRQAFAGGRDLGERDTVLIAAAACEMHPTAVLKGIALRSVTSALDQAVQRAGVAGVSALPAIQVGELVFEGDRCVEDAALALGARA